MLSSTLRDLHVMKALLGFGAWILIMLIDCLVCYRRSRSTSSTSFLTCMFRNVYRNISLLPSNIRRIQWWFATISYAIKPHPSKEFICRLPHADSVAPGLIWPAAQSDKRPTLSAYRSMNSVALNLFDVCGQCSSRSAYAYAPSGLRITLFAVLQIRVSLTYQPTVQLSDQTAWMHGYLFSHDTSHK